MATKYTILETDHTEESDPYTRKEYAVRDADKLAEQYPGTEFAVATSSGKVVHKVKTDVPEVDENVDPAPVDEVPEVQVDTAEEGDAFGDAMAEVLAEDADADFDPEDPDNDVDTDADNAEDNTPDDNGDAAGQDGAEEDSDADTEPGHGLEVVSTEQAIELLAQSPDATGNDVLAAVALRAVAAADADTPPAPAAPATPVATAPEAAPQGATLELCAPNTNAKRMHYRPIGETRTICGSANTSRRANTHQIETAALCPKCELLAKGKTVDTRPAGAGRGTRKAPKRLVVDAGDIRDLVAHLKQGLPYSMELADGTRIDVVGGDPATKELDEPDKDNLSDIRSINIVSS